MQTVAVSILEAHQKWTMSGPRKLVASQVWRQIQGILCVFKPTDMSLGRLMHNLQTIIAADLGKMINRRPRKIMQYDALKGIATQTEDIDYSDHPLVIGPRYIKSDIRYHCESALTFHACGVCLVGLNKGRFLVGDLEASKPLRVYHIVGELGVATDNLFKTGKVVEKASYGKVTRFAVDRVAALFQSNHQRLMYKHLGVPIESQTAYEAAAQGLVRPANDDQPVIYGIKCIKFEKPFFTLEVTCVNEREDYLLDIVNTFGLKLNTVARCIHLKCIRYGPFTLDHALLPHSWRAEKFASNIQMCNAVNSSDLESGRRDEVGMTLLNSIPNQGEFKQIEDVDVTKHSEIYDSLKS